MPTERKNIRVTKENGSGRNLRFLDPTLGKEMTRVQFTKEIDKGNYLGYYTRKINGLETPVSKPDNKANNNLG